MLNWFPWTAKKNHWLLYFLQKRSYNFIIDLEEKTYRKNFFSFTNRFFCSLKSVRIRFMLIVMKINSFHFAFPHSNRTPREYLTKCIPSNSINSKCYSRGFFYAFDFIRALLQFCFMCWISIALSADFLAIE